MRPVALYPLAVILLAGAFSPAMAQSVLYEPGVTVRFREGAGEPRIARASRLTPDSLILESCEQCSRLSYHRKELNEFEAYRGSARGKHMRAGVAIGTFAGIGYGLVSMAANCRCHGDTSIYVALPYATVIGAVIGAFVGYMIPGERWDKVY